MKQSDKNNFGHITTLVYDSYIYHPLFLCISKTRREHLHPFTERACCKPNTGTQYVCDAEVGVDRAFISHNNNSGKGRSPVVPATEDSVCQCGP